jgi:hypothetical protein
MVKLLTVDLRMRRLIVLLLASASLRAQPAFFRKDIPAGEGASPIAVGLAFRSWTCRLPSGVNDPGPRQRCPTGTVGRLLTVLLNAGGGNFAPPIETVIDIEVPFYIFPFPADVNGDGKLDLLVRVLGTACFLPGRGNGAFLQPREIDRGYIVATGDFNGDRIPDLLFGRDPVYPPFVDPTQPPPQPPTPPLEILLGNGKGFFQLGTKIEFSRWTHVADCNRDGRSDLATVLAQSETQTTMGIHLAQADGSLRAPVRTVIESSQWLVADFNRYGVPDLVTSAAILLGKGDGSFQPPRPYASFEAARQWTGPFAAADFTGDGLVDVAVAHRSDDDHPARSFSVLAGRGDGTFASPVQ